MTSLPVIILIACLLLIIGAISKTGFRTGRSGPAVWRALACAVIATAGSGACLLDRTGPLGPVRTNGWPDAYFGLRTEAGGGLEAEWYPWGLGLDLLFWFVVCWTVLSATEGFKATRAAEA